MSYVSFTSRERSVRVGGKERAYCGWYIGSQFKALLDLEAKERFCPKEARSKLTQELDSWKYLYIMQAKVFDGKEYDLFHCALNTAILLGSDPVKFMARVHAQCEVHGWVSGENRAWLAYIVEKGITTKILRKETQGYGKGWEDVVELLKESDMGEVVMDYSVCESFPRHEFDYDFDKSIEWVKGKYEVELKPEDWDDYYFGEGLTVFDISLHIDEFINAHSG